MNITYVWYHVHLVYIRVSFVLEDIIWWIIQLITTMVEMIPNHLGYWLDTYIEIQLACEFLFNAYAQMLNVCFKFGDA